MTDVLIAAAATIEHDGEVYELRSGPIPDGTPRAVVDRLRKMGGLAAPDDAASVALAALPIDPRSVGSGGAVGAPDPDGHLQPGADASSSGSSTEMPDGAPDAATADVADLAVFIDEHNLTGPQTVALAGGTSEGARKVIEAEQTASGGDGRATVIAPLKKLAAK